MSAVEAAAYIIEGLDLVVRWFLLCLPVVIFCAVAGSLLSDRRLSE